MRQLCIVWLLFQYAHRNPVSGADVGTIQCAKHFNDTDVVAISFAISRSARPYRNSNETLDDRR